MIAHMKVQKIDLGDLCDLVRGVTFDSKEVSNLPIDGYIPILRAGNIGLSLEIHNDLIWVPANRVSWNQYLRPGDIAICMASGSSAVLGKTAQLKNEFKGSVGAFCGIIRPRKDLQDTYISYWFQSSEFYKWRDMQARGVNIQNLRFSELSKIPVPIISTPEMQRISLILEKADRLRRLRRYALEVGETFLQSVFLEMFGDRSKFDFVEFGDILAEGPKNGLYLPAESYGSGTPIIRIDAFYDGVLSNPSLFKRVQATPRHIKEFSVENGEILINRVNSLEYLGKCAFVKGLTEPTLFESNMMRIRLNRKIAHPIYVAIYLTTQQAYSQILQKAKKAVNQASINQQDVKALMILLPPIAIQEHFAWMARRYERLRDQQSEAEHQAERLFQSLLRQAFRGEL